MNDHVIAESIFARFTQLNLIHCVSFGQGRVSKSTILDLLPELKILDEFNSHSFIEEWLLRMEAHNGTVRKGVVMGLIREYDASSLVFYSIPYFILTLQSAVLAKLLDACCTLGERVIPAIVQEQDANFWVIKDPLLITRDRWFSLCRRILKIVCLMSDFFDLHATRLSPCPERSIVKKAIARTQSIYGPYDELGH
jgi:hypothetical protein